MATARAKHLELKPVSLGACVRHAERPEPICEGRFLTTFFRAQVETDASVGAARFALLAPFYGRSPAPLLCARAGRHGTSHAGPAASASASVAASSSGLQGNGSRKLER